ncbi:MAG: UDP-3-O-(3-hydroxymyristoyl)glucosamine N-acyltransferase, partial [Pseudomonadota bacterium]|nr:UDP-3-O-(3-hydroxymyristoyl)glucosamine N-acyltransferase [Pseudomonadota bacterium]
MRFGLTLRGDPESRVCRVATLAQAGEGALSFLANSRYRRQLGSTRATAVIIARDDLEACPVAALIDPDPYRAYAQIASLLHPAPACRPGIDSTAVVARDARIAATASVGPLCVIESGVVIADRVQIGAGCQVLAGSLIGEDTKLMPRVTLYSGVHIGKRCLLHSGAVIGADGFGFAPDQGGWLKVPQVGGVRIGDDVEIGANTTVDRGAIDDTVIEDGVKLDNQIQVGHNVS